MPRQWKKAIVASAAALTAMGVCLDAQALALGAITVRSALGEPLRAEIEVPQISSEEASSFKASLASPQAFSAAGMDYSPALSGARLTLERRSNGQAYLRLQSDRPINEPLLGVIIEANWASGRMVRDYTMLVDPPGKVAAAPVTAPRQAPSIQSETVPRVSARRTPVAEQTTPPSAQRPAPQRRSAAEGTGAAKDTVVVRRGDTAYRIASANLPEGVSLDQMLMAMLRANPDAFIRGNVNLLKTGAVLQVPSGESAESLPRPEARRAVLAQSRDFNAYRQRLAQHAPQTTVESASRTASGRVTAQVQENSSAPPPSDRLTISKGATGAAAAAASSAEAGVSQSRQAQDQKDRIAELNRNIAELSRLQGASDAGAAAPAPAAAPSSESAGTSAPSVDVATGASPAAGSATAAATEPASAPGAATTPVAAASATAAPASAPGVAPVAKPAPEPEAEPSFLESLTENPLLPVAGAGLLALLLGYGLYRVRQKRKADSALDSALSEGDRGDSFFGSSGGGHVDTKERGTRLGGQSSLIYSPSQIDAAGDVDPVAEADVYLAYGRDMQAEEILKEALRTHPGRISIHRKLAEIYAKRRDARALEAVAAEVRILTKGTGPDWDHVQNLGKSLEPTNGMYAAGSVFAADKPRDTVHGFGPDTTPMASRPPEEGAPSSQFAALDLDLENALVKASPKKSGASQFGTGNTAPATKTSVKPVDDMPTASLSAPLSVAPIPPVATAPSVSSAPSAMLPPDMPSLDFDLDTMPGATTTPPKAAAPTPAPADAVDSGMIEFDLDALSIDPATRSSERNTQQPEYADEDPFSTKLELAQEFNAIGDRDGAISLIKEVMAEASGPVRARAERFLRELS